VVLFGAMPFSSVFNVSQSLIYRLGGEKYERFIHIFLNWKRVVGDLLASRSYPLKLENNVLFVAVQNNTWMQELVLLKPDIMSKYKNIFQEELAEIVFLIGQKSKKCKKR
jgi:hypothetical protein